MNTTPSTPESPDPQDTIKGSLKKAIRYCEAALSMYAGHDDYQGRKIAYWAVATHFLPQFAVFPALVPYGPPSTGKSSTLDVLKKTTRRAVSITGEAITEAALKACMNQANEGTLIGEEADKFSAADLEGILITRYSRSSADAAKMKPVGERVWMVQHYATFGATALHRRNLFRDPALSRRVITVKTSRRKGPYPPFDPDHPIFRLYKESLKTLPKLSLAEDIWDIEPGVFDCYRPLVTLARYIDDEEFLSQLRVEMEKASLNLIREEGYLEAQTILRVLVGLVYDVTAHRFTIERINVLVRNLRPALQDEFGSSCSVLMMSANQRNRIIEDDLGFEVKSAGGRQRIYLTIPLLIEKCDEYGVKDDVIEEWRNDLGNLKKGS